jgi:hypothetical protein
MSHSRRFVAAMATLAVLLALPAAASARSSTELSSAGVQSHVVKAQQAITRMNRAAAAGNTTGVVRQLRSARSQAAAASREARALATGSDSVAAAQALTLAGTTYEQLIAAITKLVDEVSGQAQAAVAQAIRPSLAGQHQVIGSLTSLLDDMPASVRPIVAAIVTSLAVGDADEVVNMDSALGGGALPGTIASLVKQALAMATQFIDRAFSAVKAIVPMLPAPAQAPMTQVLTMGTQAHATTMAAALSTVTGLIDTILGSLPFTKGPAGASSPANVFGGLLGDLTGGGQSALPGDSGNLLSTLMRELFGSGSAAAPDGIGGIISRIMEFINSLLSGLFGGHQLPAPAA